MGAFAGGQYHYPPRSSCPTFAAVPLCSGLCIYTRGESGRSSTRTTSPGPAHFVYRERCASQLGDVDDAAISRRTAALVCGRRANATRTLRDSDRSSIVAADPQTGVAPGVTRGRNVRSRCRCSMCPAIHINSRSWLRSSSTGEPSDPPHRVVFRFRSELRWPVTAFPVPHLPASASGSPLGAPVGRSDEDLRSRCGTVKSRGVDDETGGR